MTRRTVMMLATLLAGCGGGGSTADDVADCLDIVTPRVHACIPASYRGMDAAPLRPCVSALAPELRECRALGAGEFAAQMDRRVGHALARVLESVAEGAP